MNKTNKTPQIIPSCFVTVTSSMSKYNKSFDKITGVIDLEFGKKTNECYRLDRSLENRTRYTRTGSVCMLLQVLGKLT